VWFIALAATAYVAAVLAVTLGAPPRCDIGAETDIGCARGFETRERDGARSFRWTNGAALVRLHAAGYGTPLLLKVALAAPRTPGASPVAAQLSAGRLQARLLAGAPRHYHLLVPAAPLAVDLLTVGITSETWRPAGDRRTLGVQVSDVQLRATGELRLPGPFHALALLALGLATALFTVRAGLHQLAFPLAMAAVVLAGLLWALLPARVAPFLPGLALILGTAALFPIKQLLPLTNGGSGRALPSLKPTFRQPASATLPDQPLRASGELVAIGPDRSSSIAALFGAIAVGTAIEAAFAAGVLRGSWSAAGVILQGGVTLGAVWLTRGLRLSLAALLGVALAVRLLALAARLLTGGAGSDADVELFYSYGRATLELGLPVVEYPSGALAPWALMALPGSRELFALLLPLLNTLCDLAIVWGLYRISSMAHTAHDSGESSFSSAFSLFYALSPLLLPFWYGKFDSLPSALLVLGLVAFLARRPAQAGALLGLGGTVKWVPWLAAPAIALHELRVDWQQNKGESFVSSCLRAFVFRFSLAVLAAIAVASLPFALRDPAAFLAPYTMQGGRPLIGESVWFLPAVLLEPRLLGELIHPWSNVKDAPIAPAFTVAVQAMVLAALLLPVLLRPPERQRTLALAVLAPAAFLLLNRVFSPQYVLIITACALAAGAAVLRERDAPRLIALLTIAQTANLLVWPHTARGWLVASAVLFAAALGMLAWLAIRAAQFAPTQPDASPQRASPVSHHA
jgi:hypothetical protein